MYSNPWAVVMKLELSDIPRILKELSKNRLFTIMNIGSTTLRHAYIDIYNNNNNNIDSF
jgi:hypothetical protein